VRVPGDKSMSHRALILGTLARGTTRIAGLLEGEDVLATADAMRQYGATITAARMVFGPSKASGVGALLEPEQVIDCGNAGTGVRLIMGMAAAYPFASTFTGDGSLRKRPMKRVLNPLQAMGVQVLARDGGLLPLTIRGNETPLPVTYTVPMPSAQVKSAVLLAALSTEGTTTVIEPIPTRDHSERMIKGFGGDLSVEENTDGSRTIIVQWRQGADRAGCDHSGRSVLGGLSAGCRADRAGQRSCGARCDAQPDAHRPDHHAAGDGRRPLTLSNRRTEGGEELADITARSSQLKGITVPAERAPSMIDEYPVLAVAASFAEGETHMPGLHELRVKESDRLAAVVDGLTANGVT
jgi:3-phosphoshikimate 1-carboxyvinyltransferase